ncbi:hypothetical protein DFH06DRAFT_1149946 [Mycena polygramma]|nr:hypothetical protein DFH06DRAFT_1149946 [Mycena polygramma]
MSITVDGYRPASVTFSSSPRTKLSPAFRASLRQDRDNFLFTCFPSVASRLNALPLSFTLTCPVSNAALSDVVLGLDWSAHIRDSLLALGHRLESTFDSHQLLGVPTVVGASARKSVPQSQTPYYPCHPASGSSPLPSHPSRLFPSATANGSGHVPSTRSSQASPFSSGEQHLRSTGSAATQRAPLVLPHLSDNNSEINSEINSERPSHTSFTRRSSHREINTPRFEFVPVNTVPYTTPEHQSGQTAPSSVSPPSQCKVRKPTYTQPFRQYTYHSPPPSTPAQPIIFTRVPPRQPESSSSTSRLETPPAPSTLQAEDVL